MVSTRSTKHGGSNNSLRASFALRLSGRRRKVIRVGALASFALFGSAAHAAVIMYEPFNYTAGTPLGGTVAGSPGGYTSPTGEVWYSRSANTAGYDPTKDVQVVGNNLSYPGLMGSAGNMVTYGSSSIGGVANTNNTLRSVSVGLPNPISSGDVYFSAIVRLSGLVTNGTAAPAGRHLLASLSIDPSTGPGTDLTTYLGTVQPQPSGLWVRPQSGSTATNIQFGAGKTNTDAISRAGSATWQANPLASNTTGSSGQAWLS